jgi:cytochrome c2
MSGVVWNEKTLNSFLEDARGYIPGCKHNMPGKYKYFLVGKK